MTKSEQREIPRIRYYVTMGAHDVAARSLSALIRAASSRSRAALLAEARALSLTSHPEFII